MTVSGYLAELTSYLPFLPAAVLCYCPMKHQLKLKNSDISLHFYFFITLIPIAAYLKCRFSLSDNFFTFPMLILFFILSILCMRKFQPVSGRFCFCMCPFKLFL